MLYNYIQCAFDITFTCTCDYIFKCMLYIFKWPGRRNQQATAKVSVSHPVLNRPHHHKVSLNANLLFGWSVNHGNYQSDLLLKTSSLCALIFFMGIWPCIINLCKRKFLGTTSTLPRNRKKMQRDRYNTNTCSWHMYTWDHLALNVNAWYSS